ncbi:hypothetical protein GURASL_14050 [Geotalea uraniireducens]|uniref:Uncharacterized protein n=1 Tax=Geotalea uraniireducens TaxID=351604 RepID=A0ABM8EJ56_9BACT|nr:hypothetical protein [Geotalea uraniireducens]BDV42482.1 hypothetical protein GURASL_14050 [Geotalea uraniireducens]
MNRYLATRTLGFMLLIVSLVLYGIDYLALGGGREIASGFLGNFAFLPLYVLFVTLMIERVLKERERISLRRKLNMVIGVFFSEVGTELLRNLTDFLPAPAELERRLQVRPQWTANDFRELSAFLAAFELQLDSRMGDLAYLRHFLVGKREFMLRLLENPNLLEHDEFTDLLWAVFHLVDELMARTNLAELSQPDLDHLAGDMRRAFGHLLREWVIYMTHLKADYPYLFSLAVRMNPLDPEAHAEVD